MFLVKHLGNCLRKIFQNTDFILKWIGPLLLCEVNIINIESYGTEKKIQFSNDLHFKINLTMQYLKFGPYLSILSLNSYVFDIFILFSN